MIRNNDTREERGKAIAENGNVKKVNDHSFKVKSQSGSKVYEVKATPNGMTCTCPDFVHHDGMCSSLPTQDLDAILAKVRSLRSDLEALLKVQKAFTIRTTNDR